MKLTTFVPVVDFTKNNSYEVNLYAQKTDLKCAVENVINDSDKCIYDRSVFDFSPQYAKVGNLAERMNLPFIAR